MPRILLVDDEQALLDLFSAHLRKSGHDVSCSTTAGGAIAALAGSGPFDAVVLDLWLAGEDGLVVLARLLEQYPEIRVLAASGAPADLSSLKVGPRQRVSFLQKPFLPRDLARALEALLEP